MKPEVFAIVKTFEKFAGTVDARTVADTAANIFVSVFTQLAEAAGGDPAQDMELKLGNRRVTIHAAEPEIVRVK